MRAWWSVVSLVALAVAGSARRHPDLAAAARTGAQPDPAERTADFWLSEAKQAITRRLNRPENVNKARNVVMFLGDGMSVPTLAAARALLGQRVNRTGEEAQLSFEAFPTVGLAKTYCVDAQIADSACTATAYLCGVKNNYGTIGLTAEVPRYDCLASTRNATHLDSIAAWALADGRDAGIVTTTRITHASPAGAYAKVANRYWEHDYKVVEDGGDPTVCRDIAHQLVHSYPGNHFKVILGGGRREFLSNTTVDEESTPGLRTDGRNLIKEWIDDKITRNVTHQYVWNRDQLMGTATSPPEYLLGLFEGSHMQYHLEANKTTEPTLAELTEVAIRSLSRNKKGFFLFVEGGRIDHAHHDNLVHLALDETLELSAAVARAAEILDEDDSLLVVTSDHAHVMAFNGYTRRGGDILGLSDDLDDHDMPYMTLSYTNGPGFRPHINGTRTNITQEENFSKDNVEWLSHADVPLEFETHGGDDVAVFALGPHHQLFTGLYEQSQVPHLMAHAACLGPHADAAHCSAVAAPRALAAAVFSLLVLALLRSCHLQMFI